jgi:HlyD family secretion protein
MSSRKSKWIKRIILIGVLAGAGVWMAAGLEPSPIPAEVSTATRGPLRVTVDGMGKTRMRDHRTVCSPASGELSRITLRPGDVVTKGQIIATIRPGVSQPLDARSRAETVARLAAAKAALAEARRNVDRAKIASDLATSEVERTQYLVKTKAAPSRNLEIALADQQTRNADLELSKLAVERARLEAAAVAVTLAGNKKKKGKSSPHEIEVTAPSAGVVLAVHTESAGPTAVGTPLIEIGDPNTVELAVDLPTPSAVRISPGAKVTIDDMGDDKTRAGIVRLIEPAAYTKVTALGVEEQRVNVIVRMTEPPPVLGDGFSADAHIEIEKSKDVLKVPSGAVFRDGKKFAVFKVEKGIAKRSAVEIGLRNADEAAIKGLKEGTVVVVHPSDKIKDGVTVAEEL